MGVGLGAVAFEAAFVAFEVAFAFAFALGAREARLAR